MSNQLLTRSKVVQSQLRTDLPDFKAGSVVKVHYKIIEENKERVQIFSGLVVSRHGGNGLDATFTVLKNATAGIKVHRTFPLHSPLITKIDLVSPVQRGRRSKLYFAAKLKDPIKSIRTKAMGALKVKVKEEAPKEIEEATKTTPEKEAAKKTTKAVKKTPAKTTKKPAAKKNTSKSESKK